MSSPKRFNIGKALKKTIATHSGTFHCDEALACFLLRNTLQFKNAEIKRTRNEEELKTADIVVDVGGVYDPQAMRFDHHQRSFAETFSVASPVKLSSAGLVYKHFGREILQKILRVEGETLEVLYKKIYFGFIREIDAIDNGEKQYDTNESPRYEINTNLAKRVAWLNPSWNCDENDNIDSRFEKAMELTGSEFVDCAESYLESWLPALEIVKRAFAARLDTDESEKILKLERYCPWKSHLLHMEGAADVLYVIFESYGNWRITAVPLNENSFENRKPLPKEWRGLRDESLEKKSNVSGAVFVHASGFTGANKTYEGALKMAQIAIKMD